MLGNSLPIGLISALLLALPLCAHADQVIGIADGDTLTVLHDRNPLKIRLANIDSPEKAQSFGARSKQSLSDMCYRKDATYKVQNIDRYGRTVAVVTCAGIEVNRAQVERGLAWVYVRFAGKNSELIPLETNARNAKIGLWIDNRPTPPWEFRKQSKAQNTGNGL